MQQSVNRPTLTPPCRTRRTPEPPEGGPNYAPTPDANHRPETA